MFVCTMEFDLRIHTTLTVNKYEYESVSFWKVFIIFNLSARLNGLNIPFFSGGSSTIFFEMDFFCIFIQKVGEQYVYTWKSMDNLINNGNL